MIPFLILLCFRIVIVALSLILSVSIIFLCLIPFVTCCVFNCVGFGFLILSGCYYGVRFLASSWILSSLSIECNIFVVFIFWIVLISIGICWIA
ncbi:hypothetical protein FKM82_021557 [Ascaphus truei]